MHFTKIINGEKTEYHMCEVCAKEQGDLGSMFSKGMQSFDFNQLLSGLLNMESSPGFTVPPTTALRCEHCGMTYNQFTKVGRFGCTHCYDSFAPRLEPLLRRIQTGTTHTGKVPVRAGEQVKVRKDLDRMRKELQQCVATEQFERAAELRDQIRNLEQKLAR